MPHGHCYLWQPHILWTNVISDALIALAYFSIPLAVMRFSLKRKDIDNAPVFILFSLFILLCGITHIIGIFTIWHGAYGIHGVSKLLTAIVSVTTAVYVFKLLPSAIAIPSISQFKAVEVKLDAETKSRSNLEAELQDHKLTNFILNSIPISALMLDEQQKIIFANQPFYDEFQQLDSNKIQGLTIHDIIEFTDKKDKNSFIDFYQQSAHEKSVLSLKVATKTSKDPFEINIKKSVYEGKTSILVTLKSLVEIASIKNKLLQSHQRLQRAISATDDGIWEWDINNNAVDYSPKLMEIIGKPEIESPTFNDWQSHIHPDHQADVQSALDEHFLTHKKYEVEYLGLDKQQQYSWFSAIGDTLFDENGKPTIVSGSLRNIDLTKRLERSNQEKTDFINAIYDGFSQAIWVLEVLENDDYRFLEYNNAACQWTNISVEQISNKKLSEITGTIFPEEMAIKIKQNYALCVEQKNKIDYIEKITFSHPAKWYKTTLYPILSSDNEVIKIVGTAIDVTNEQLLMEQLKESNDYLERFAFVASHDLQEPLRKIIAFSEALSTRLAEHLANDDASYELSRLTNAAARMKKMILDILSLSRINSSSMTMAQCQLGILINEVKDNLSELITRNQATIHLPSEQETLLADPALVSLLLQNLISNAIKFSHADSAPEVIFSAEKNNTHFQITCQDNGIGIPEEYQTQIFQPFRRLHPQNKYEGTGIGLSLCQQIMKAHGALD